MAYTNELVFSALQRVKYPGSDKDIVSTGMVEDIEIDGREIKFSLVLPKENDPFASSLKKACVNAIITYVGQAARVKGNIRVKSKTGTASVKTKPVNLQSTKMLSGVKNIIAIASGKGGVGKSTLATNLAISVAKQGFSVGLIDADIYGPSLPKMFDVENQKPEVFKSNGVDMIAPILKHGVKMLSIGFFVNPDDALVWRGPMATSALKQLMNQGDWGELDYMFIDLPPGTSDIHLTLVQEVAVTGAIIISTPQDIALADAVKGISMFTGDKVNVPVLGLVENMAWFTPDELPDNRYYIFGRDGCKQLAQKMGLPLLGQIPIVQSIREGGDTGKPAALDANSIVSSAFTELAEKVINQIDIRNRKTNPTQKVEITNMDGCSAAK
ncbi:MAG: Mrp/NBP35 family ATP-binding protein [Bacteroidota bacterium]|nr:Mrp/NBP35 family ATP-binding protein [Bacteroidota bacterium]